MENKTQIFLLMSGLLILSMFTVLHISNNYKIQHTSIQKPNYVGMVELGIYPGARSRNLISTDDFTGIILKSKRGEYKLMRSNSFGTFDYGKTFLYKIK